MITQSWAMTLDVWPYQADSGAWWSGVRQGSINEMPVANLASVYLPRYPLAALDTVTTYSENSAATDVSLGTFDVDTYQQPGRMTLKRGQTWPIAMRANNAIEIVYTSGYGDTAADVPAALRRAVKQAAAALYSNRGDGCGCGDVFTSSGAQGLVAAYSVARI